ncbi:PTS system mannose/fructose/sorbose family transporter subunit IID [Sporosarcina globispora]|uniref:PTS system mannose/fructose/sorbose family transporter subunit IID n=1 Tax=Sporosarcina globispora TaxID=1459 RepID=UPI0013791B2E
MTASLVLSLIGGLAVSFVHLLTTLKVPDGKETIELQRTLDSFFQGFQSLLAVLFCLYLISKKKYSGKKSSAHISSYYNCGCSIKFVLSNFRSG